MAFATLDFWCENVNMLLSFQGKEVLSGNGNISNSYMEEYVRCIYEEFDTKRKAYDAQQADKE